MGRVAEFTIIPQGFWQELILRLLNDRMPLLFWKNGALFRCKNDENGLALIEKVNFNFF